MKLATLYISKQNMAADFGKPEDMFVMANLASGADSAAVKANVGTLLQSYPQLTLNWGADYRVVAAKQLEQLFSALFLVLIALAIPSVLGLINTLAINVLERTREIGVLRAIGATRGQVRRLVVAESLLLALVGTALGLVAGIALGYALVMYIGTSVYATIYYFPVVGILVTIAAAIILALLASIIPARQASRVKIVQALQYE
jgi:putative ABC transport system permease protein